MKCGMMDLFYGWVTSTITDVITNVIFARITIVNHAAKLGLSLVS